MWVTTYRHDRRKARHRCRACRRIINVGELAIMFRPSAARRTTWAIHDTCSDTRHSDTYTWREVIAAWETDRAARLA